jgi:Na+-translocating ferredoxin:NAD+ oxidoreductase RnfD subunit
MSADGVVKAAKNPKIQIFGLLLLLSALGSGKYDFATILMQIAVALLTAVLAEWAFFGNIGIEGFRSALITGSLCGMILYPGADLRTIWVAVAVAIASKLLFRSPSGKHIFNPAATGLVVSSLFLGNQMNWWACSNVHIVIILGGLIIFRLNRLSLVFSYFLFRFISSAIFNGDGYYAVFSPNLFFAFIMLTEPKTSPGQRPAQWIFGGICGILSSLFFTVIPSLDGDLLALLAVNPLRFLLNMLKIQSRPSVIGG